MAITQPQIEIFSKFKKQNVQESLLHPNMQKSPYPKFPTCDWFSQTPSHIMAYRIFFFCQLPVLAIQTSIIKKGFWPLDFCENLYLSCFLYVQYVKKRHCTSSPWNLQLSRCCNSCEDVREAYRRKGWALQDPDGIEQCKREGWAHKMEAQKNEGCKLFGYLEVNKVSDGYMGGRLPALDGMQTN